MTDKQKRFCDEYLIDCNGTRAYKAAYPSIKTQHAAEAAANRLLSNVDVQKCIAAGLEKLHNEKTANAQEVMEYLSAVLRGCKEQVLCGAGKGEQFITEMQVSAKDRLKAAELLAKRYKMFDAVPESQTNVEDDPITKSLKEELEKK